MNTATPMSLMDLFKYHNDLVRTGKYLALGRVRIIALGPCDTYKPPANDPIIRTRGRMMDFSDQFLPIGQPDDKNQLLVTGPLRRRDGFVGLPDLADPAWRAPDFTPEEASNPDCPPDCKKEWDAVPSKKPGGPARRVPHQHVHLRGNKDVPVLVPQRLRDRTNDKLAGTNFLVFQPVLSITYQPEETKPGSKAFRPEEWGIICKPDFEGKHTTLLVDEQTGESHFVFGMLDYVGVNLRASMV